MSRLSQLEKQSLREFAKQAPLRQSAPPTLPFSDYLRMLSKLPPGLCPPKPVRFVGSQWKL